MADIAVVQAVVADEIPDLAVEAISNRKPVAKEDKTEKAASAELESLQELYAFMLEKGLDAVELKDEDGRIRLTRRMAGLPAGTVFAHHPAPARAQEPPLVSDAPVAAVSAAQTIPTPLAGVFYRASSPTSAAFIKEGDVAEPGQTLCIVEAMKVMNEIKAESRCRILKIVAENGRPLTAGQPLFEIESA